MERNFEKGNRNGKKCPRTVLKWNKGKACVPGKKNEDEIFELRFTLWKRIKCSNNECNALFCNLLGLKCTAGGEILNTASV